MLKYWRGRSEQPDSPATQQPEPQSRFYCDVLGLAIYPGFGSPEDPGPCSGTVS
jgi:hypothetical protein